jgi:hypothetical protein
VPAAGCRSSVRIPAGQVVASVQDGTYPHGQALLGVGVFPGQGAPAEADFDDLVVTKR